ncbi:MAG: hypothetical protein IJ874_00030 [Ruminococcus sp.]|nr:hypothetical protein [Ruminococcus sp.]
MKVKADGKNIATYAFGNLFIQGEKLADTIAISIDRYHDGTDLSECSFCIRGQTENGYEVQQTLIPVIGEDTITLSWCVSDSFTLNSGRLMLELRASRTDENDNDTLVLKYNMQPVSVKPTPSGSNGPLPETAEQAVSEINAAAAAGLDALSEKMDSFPIDEVTARLDAMDGNIAVFLARPEVIPMTAAEYAASVHKANSLYVIIG